MFEIDENDILVGSPKSKFFDMVFYANKNIIKEKLESKIEEFAAMELILTQTFGEEYLLKVKQAIQGNKEDIENYKNDFFINFMQDVLTEHE